MRIFTFFTSFKSSQMKSFWTLYAEHVLAPFLNQQEYNLIRDFIVYVQIISAYRVSRADVAQAQESYVRFLNGFSALYPTTPFPVNYHFGLHLPEVLLRFGPSASTWV